MICRKPVTIGRQYPSRVECTYISSAIGQALGSLTRCTWLFGSDPICISLKFYEKTDFILSLFIYFFFMFFAGAKWVLCPNCVCLKF